MHVQKMISHNISIQTLKIDVDDEYTVLYLVSSHLWSKLVLLFSEESHHSNRVCAPSVLLYTGLSALRHTHVCTLDLIAPASAFTHTALLYHNTASYRLCNAPKVQLCALWYVF